MSYPDVPDFIFPVEEYLATAIITAYWALHLYTFNFNFAVSPLYLSFGSALGAFQVFNDH
jgi:hypothetical protein